MLWFQHKKFTHDYVSAQLAEISGRVGRETRRMVCVATVSVAFMMAIQAACLYDLAGL